MAFSADFAVGNSNFQGPIVGGVQSNNISIGPVHGNVQFHPKPEAVSLASWVSDLDFSRHQSQAFEKRTPGTLEWIFESPEFNTWLNGSGGMLWASGKPGAGKTTFASFIIDYLQKLGDDDPKAVAAVCYIYCRYYKTLTAQEMFEVILKQLILCCPEVDTENLRKLKDQSRRLSLDDIVSKLKALSVRIPNIFIVIDAFDECFSEQTRHHVLSLLQSLSFIKILVTSRPLPSIASAMAGIPILVISAHEQDIKIHFQFQTRTNPGMSRLLPKHSEIDVEGKIIDNAGGMFLLAELHMKHLAAQTNTARLLHALETLPTEATATYEQTMERIRQQEPNRRQLALHTFSWIFHSPSRLSMIELRHVLAIGTLDRLAEEEELDDEEMILSSCAGLVIVNRYQTVEFLHYTVQEFLQQACTASDFLSEIAVAMTFIKIPSFPGYLSTHPLHPYVIGSWAPLIRRWEHDDAIFELVLSQLASSATIEVLRGIVRYVSPTGFGLDGYDRYLAPANALHLAAGCGLVRVVKARIEAWSQSTPTLLDEGDKYGRTALFYASASGHTTVVALLLDSQLVDINHRDLQLRTSLYWAARYGRSEVVKLLLTYPYIDIDCKDTFSRTPLSAAADEGHKAVIVELLCTPAMDINARDRSGKTALHLAAQHEPKVVQLLLNSQGVDVNALDSDGRTPLWHAICAGKTGSVTMLLNDPRVYMLGEDSHTLLWRAIDLQYSDIAKLLRASDKLDISNEDNKTLLFLAALVGDSDEVERLLLDAHVPINAKNSHGRTPLALAAKQGHLETVNQFLAHPSVDPNAKDNYGRTPFSLAAERGHLEVVKTLLHMPNIEVNPRDRLFFVAVDGRFEIIKSLLDLGVDVNEKDPEQGRTALSRAAGRGSVRAVEGLLKLPNIDINTRNDDGNTPLHLAVQSHEVVRLLLATPNIEINPENDDGLTPLLLAVANGELKSIEMLLTASLRSTSNEVGNPSTQLLQVVQPRGMQKF